MYKRQELECERSLGSVLAAAHVSEVLVKNNLVTHKRLGYLTMLGDVYKRQCCDSRGALKPEASQKVLERWGFKRTNFVLANTMEGLGFDREQLSVEDVYKRQEFDWP